MTSLLFLLYYTIEKTHERYTIVIQIVKKI